MHKAASEFYQSEKSALFQKIEIPPVLD